MRNAKILLEELTRRMPPDPPRRHGLMLGDDGRLSLQLAVFDLFVPVNFEDGDLDKPPEQMAAEIEKLVRSSVEQGRGAR